MDDYGQEDTQTKSSKPHNVHWRFPQGFSKGASQSLGISKSPLMLVSNTAPARRAEAPTYALSFAAGRPVHTNSADTIADGLAVRAPDNSALEVIRRGASHIVKVSEGEIRQAMRILFTDTHNVAEGAGAAALAAALQERGRLAGKRVAVIQSGGNIDRSLFTQVLAEEDAA